MSAQENKELVRRFFDERWNKQNYAVVDELVPADEADEHKDWVRRMHATVGELQLTIDDLIAEGDLVALHWSISGVLSTAVNGVGAAGDRLSWSGEAMLRVQDGKILDDRAYADELGTSLYSSL
jgi:predicted ester cyclase